jgi:hypothetical protein
MTQRSDFSKDERAGRPVPTSSATLTDGGQWRSGNWLTSRSPDAPLARRTRHSPPGVDTSRITTIWFSSPDGGVCRRSLIKNLTRIKK